MASIKAIEGRSVHQIQSGQVIVDLISVVKELVENGLDAGATSIEVRFKNNGLDNIEVQDNGRGIRPEDFETVALKHYTSKLASYDDLTSLNTFGFRGEALSSLCALSSFHIVTARNEDGAVGKKLEFGTSGKLLSTTVVAAQPGTTVSVENLFNSLPVRRKELEKNIKREYNKALSHLYAYACISVGARFSVSNQMPKGRKTTVFSTKLNTTTKENVTNVFGAKMTAALVKLDLHLEMMPAGTRSTQGARNLISQVNGNPTAIQVQGHISKPVFGEGRQAPDRQMYFVNSRPCLLPQVSKVFNEIYRSFNSSQSPFVLANLIMDTNAYDVNVSPDKRTIMLHDQTALLESLKTALIDLFEKTGHSVPMSQVLNSKLQDHQPLTLPRRTPTREGLLLSEDCSLDGQGDVGHEEAEPRDANDADLRRHSTVLPPTRNGLIHDWAGRDAVNRNELRPRVGSTGGRSRSNEDLVRADRCSNARGARPSDEHGETNRSALIDGYDMQRHAVKPHDAHAQTNEARLTSTSSPSSKHDFEEPDPMGSPYDDLFSQRPVESPGLYRAGSLVGRSSTEINAANSSIPSVVVSSQRAVSGPVQSAFDRMRPKRTPSQVAEITVGGNATRTVLGGGSAFKRRRLGDSGEPMAISRQSPRACEESNLRSFSAPGLEIVTRRDLPAADVAQSERFANDVLDEGSYPSTEGYSAGPQDGENVSASDDAEQSDDLNALAVEPVDGGDDNDYIDGDGERLQEEQRIARLIHEAEQAAARPSIENLRRASQVLANTGNRKESTLRLAQYVDTSVVQLKGLMASAELGSKITNSTNLDVEDNALVKDELDDADAENRLSLTVSKADFERMEIVGQFNLGFILAVRPSYQEKDEDDLFIIDQHAADEKYNYERFQRTVTLQSQRLVRPKALDLTAVEEEIVQNNAAALRANGFEFEEIPENADDDNLEKCHYHLLTLPISGEKTFTLSDLEELLHLLSEHPAGSSEIPRPRKVQKMLAMRACRSSIMVGRTLTTRHMQTVVRHMGEMEKPWNCPHGRPTMRHLAGVGAWKVWDERPSAVLEGDEGLGSSARRQIDWHGYVSRHQR